MSASAPRVDHTDDRHHQHVVPDLEDRVGELVDRVLEPIDELRLRLLAGGELLVAGADLALERALLGDVLRHRERPDDLPRVVAQRSRRHRQQHVALGVGVADHRLVVEHLLALERPPEGEAVVGEGRLPVGHEEAVDARRVAVGNVPHRPEHLLLRRVVDRRLVLARHHEDAEGSASITARCSASDFRRSCSDCASASSRRRRSVTSRVWP